MKLGNAIKITKQIMASLVFGLILAVLIVGIFQSEASRLAESLKLVGNNKVEISRLLDGDWDFACVISETARPETVASQVTQKTLKFEEAGNSNRNLLYDGETGLVLVSNSRGTYALYLVFSESKTAIIHTDGPQCLPFKRARLAEISKTEEWRYFGLLDCGSC